MQWTPVATGHTFFTVLTLGQCNKKSRRHIMSKGRKALLRMANEHFRLIYKSNLFPRLKMKINFQLVNHPSWQSNHSSTRRFYAWLEGFEGDFIHVRLNPGCCNCPEHLIIHLQQSSGLCKLEPPSVCFTSVEKQSHCAQLKLLFLSQSRQFVSTWTAPDCHADFGPHE